GVSGGIVTGPYVRADRTSFLIRTLPSLEETSSVTSPIRPTYRFTLQGEGPILFSRRLVSKIRSQTSDAIEITVTIINCTYSGSPKTSAMIAVSAPAAIRRKVISPVTTCTLISNKIGRAHV